MKSSKGKTITIIILIIIILGLGCYIAYDKGVFNSLLNKNNTKEEKKTSSSNDGNEGTKNNEEYILTTEDGASINLMSLKEDLINKVNSNDDVKIILSTCNSDSGEFVSNDTELTTEAITPIIEKLKTTSKVETSTSDAVCPSYSFSVARYENDTIAETYLSFNSHNDGKEVPIGIYENGYSFTFNTDDFNDIFTTLLKYKK